MPSWPAATSDSPPTTPGWTPARPSRAGWRASSYSHELTFCTFPQGGSNSAASTMTICESFRAVPEPAKPRSWTGHQGEEDFVLHPGIEMDGPSGSTLGKSAATGRRRRRRAGDCQPTSPVRSRCSESTAWNGHTRPTNLHRCRMEFRFMRDDQPDLGHRLRTMQAQVRALREHWEDAERPPADVAHLILVIDGQWGRIRAGVLRGWVEELSDLAQEPGNTASYNALVDAIDRVAR